MEYFYGYLIFINIVSFIVMLLDKQHAERHKWRTPEKRLFLYAFLFGSIGIWSGMYVLRHKTKHRKFVFGIPAIIAAQIILLYKLLI